MSGSSVEQPPLICGESQERTAGRGTVREWVTWLEARLRAHETPSARAEAEWMVAGTLGVSRTELYLWEDPLAEAIRVVLDERLRRRLIGEPLQYVLGEAEFCGHRLTVSPSVLIPRPESEVLVVEAVARLTQGRHAASSACRLLDLGTGSGNMAISLAKAVPTCVVVAVELSWDALQVAQTNVRRHHLAGRIHLVQSDWTGALQGFFSLIIANPPYVPNDEVQQRPPDTRWEPAMSLDGGRDGMRFHARLIEDAPRLLARGGWLGMECAEHQAQALYERVNVQPWVARAQIIQDLTGRPRGLWVERTRTVRGDGYVPA